MATRPAGIGAGSVVGNDGEWKSATKLDHSAHLPVRNHCIDERMQILSPSPVAADGNFLNRITGEDVRNVVVAGPPLGPLIVEILPVRRGRRRLAPGTEVAGLLAWTADGRSKPMAEMDCHRVHDSLVRPQPSLAACCWGSTSRHFRVYRASSAQFSRARSDQGFTGKPAACGGPFSATVWSICCV